MKKHLALLIFLFGLFFSLQSQNWCPPGAKWQYAWQAGGLGLDAVVTYEYKKDTTING